MNKEKKSKNIIEAPKEIKREAIDSDHIKITYDDKSEQIILV